MLFQFGSWLATNRQAQYVIGIIAALFALRLWLWRHNESIRRQERYKAQRRTEELQKQIEEDSHDFVEDARNARDTSPHYPTADSLPEHIRRLIIKPDSADAPDNY